MIGKACPESNGASAATSAGASPSSSSESPGSSDAGCDISNGLSSRGACAAAQDVVVLTIVRSCLWADGAGEDVWKVEVDSKATIAELKARIADLYEVPKEEQRLQRTKDPNDHCLPDSARIGELGRQPVYLLPVAAGSPAPDLSDIHLEMVQDEEASDEERESQFFERLQAQEQQQAALVESLEKVTYGVHIVLDASLAKGNVPPLHLTLAALAPVGSAQESAEVKFFGIAGERPFCIVFNGQPLPPNYPLHFAGVRDGDTLVLATGSPIFYDEDEDSDSDSLDDGMLAWANR